MPDLRRARKPLPDEADELRAEIRARLPAGRNPADASDQDWYVATAHAVRDRVLERWAAQDHGAPPAKRVYYLSIEYLIGRLLLDVLVNLDLVEPVRRALAYEGIDLDAIRDAEPDAGLGNGGLGRLAACLMDSMACLKVPALGYGIRYDKGFFEQQLDDGWQREATDDWLAAGNPWETERVEIAFPVSFGGMVEYVGPQPGPARGIWYPSETIFATCYDTPVTGWRGRRVNTLRLWSARAVHCNTIHSYRATDGAWARAISRSLYPSDVTAEGKELRLRQEYFFTSASLQDIVQRHMQERGDLDSLPARAAIQLNDTHPALAVAELMRILVDEHDFSWERAWAITTSTLNYTNHTLLPEALERWPVELMNRLLPRHLQIIYLINWFHLEGMRAAGITDPAVISAASLIEESPVKAVRMGHLAFVGSHKVNGVSALHTRLMRHTVFDKLESSAPHRIVNKTNGVSFRRWLIEANQPLTRLLARHIGTRFYEDGEALAGLEALVGNAAFIHGAAQVRLDNKQRLAGYVHEMTGVVVDPTALFDVQIKRIHEYKRQLLNILEAVALFHAIRAQPDRDWTPRVRILAGKAAPDYARAKLIIKLAHDVGQVINNDPIVGDRLKLVFLPNYGVRLAEVIIPAADLSEQISTAGMEASGTGNMKLALNGALTIGTLDGANVEIRERVGAENVFIFGLNAEEVEEKRRLRWQGQDSLRSSQRLAEVLDSISSGLFSPEQPSRFRELVEAVRGYDHFMVAADFDAYWEMQRSVDALWRQPEQWWRKSILNTARMGWFSSDRTIREYASEIWNIPLEN